MRRLPPSFDASLSAFREITAELAEGGATRARVLVEAEREARQRNGLRGSPCRWRSRWRSCSPARR